MKDEKKGLSSTPPSSFILHPSSFRLPPLHLLGVSASGDIANWAGLPEEDAGQLSWITRGPLAAAATASLPPSTGPLQHARLLLAIHRRACVLPVRYGTVVPDATAVEQFLGRHEEELLRQLARLRGTTEMGVRLTLDARPTEGSVRGSARKCRRRGSCGKILGHAPRRLRPARRVE